MTTAVKRAIIIGGGIGGLSAAIGLGQAGIDAIVYEQTAELGRVGAGITLWANAIKALRWLGVAGAVQAAGTTLRTAEIRDASGRVLSRTNTAALEQEFGAPNVAIHRADLHRALLSALPAAAVCLGTTFTHFEQNDGRVIAHFAGGHSDEADLLIGADGIHSAVRHQLFPEVRLRYADYTAWRGVATIEDVVPPGAASESWGCGRRFGIVRINAQQVYWFATANMPEGQSQPVVAEKALLLRHFGDWHEPVGLLIDVTPAAAVLRNDIYDFKPVERWHNGRVVLLGDAIHATTPNVGQGACQAIESAAVLTHCLVQEADLSAALHAYGRRRRGRTAWITNSSWRLGRVAQIENRWLCALRNALLRAAPESIMEQQLAAAAGYDVRAG